MPEARTVPDCVARQACAARFELVRRPMGRLFGRRVLLVLAGAFVAQGRGRQRISKQSHPAECRRCKTSQTNCQAPLSVVRLALQMMATYATFRAEVSNPAKAADAGLQTRDGLPSRRRDQRRGERAVRRARFMMPSCSTTPRAARIFFAASRSRWQRAARIALDQEVARLRDDRRYVSADRPQAFLGCVLGTEEAVAGFGLSLLATGFGLSALTAGLPPPALPPVPVVMAGACRPPAVRPANSQ